MNDQGEGFYLVFITQKGADAHKKINAFMSSF